MSELFNLFFDDTVINVIVEETNKYASAFFELNPDKKANEFYKEWILATSQRIKAFLALTIHMGIKRFPHINHH